MELYSAQIRKVRLGPPTGASPARTTGDFEVVISAELIESYSLEFDSLVKEQPKAFIESVEMVSGSIRKVDVSDKLRKQLSRTRSVAEFLSIRDLVDRHIKDYTKPTIEKSKKASLFFWRKAQRISIRLFETQRALEKAYTDTRRFSRSINWQLKRFTGT